MSNKSEIKESVNLNIPVTLNECGFKRSLNNNEVKFIEVKSFTKSRPEIVPINHLEEVKP